MTRCAYPRTDPPCPVCHRYRRATQPPLFGAVSIVGVCAVLAVIGWWLS